ncbi:DUF4159 domain-containing protein [Stratiformator vulcanicus]|uniref:DUF4159 domain-containing protein n=1 Tax=Stratiformator vulcanicus TaxID=2527980 RepID=A0A517QZQ4_9PLAN|nr:DUF4159 domain-containing protein [Stratiformator vulcanicus]QDT37030.1 hypothetical protein Pan189_13960 [Stratiformator vulcanicus]
MRHGFTLLLSFAVCVGTTSPTPAQDLSSKEVLESIDRGVKFLLNEQNANGSWTASNDQFEVGVTSLSVLALINSGKKTDDPAVRKGIAFLRKNSSPKLTYEISLLIMALAAAKDGQRDLVTIRNLADDLERGQIVQGQGRGSWTYSVQNGLLNLGGDRSNGQYAVLGLREAVYSGVPVDRKVWDRVRQHWLASQNRDGGWGYTGLGGGTSLGSMTVAGIATLSIVQSVMAEDELNADGNPVCCGGDGADEEIDEALARADRWMQRRFSVKSNPGSPQWLLYYLYGLERAGRLSGKRFFGEHDWYREGADFLLRGQSNTFGYWKGNGGTEADPVVGTAFSLLFLSKGLAPVLINKLEYGPNDPVGADDRAWTRYENDARNLTEHVSGLERWPKLLTWQVVDLEKATKSNDVAALLQAPVLYFSGDQPIEMTEAEIKLLRRYVDLGGFIFAVNNCKSKGFEKSVVELVLQMYPDDDLDLRRLEQDHPIFRAEYRLDSRNVELHGVDVGCRTSIVYSPDDLSCLWDRWLPVDPPGRSPKLVGQIARKMRIGVNVLAYATGREPPAKLDVETPEDDAEDDTTIKRGLLEIAKLKHGGSWDVAPRALKNLLRALNEKAGLAASTKPNELVATDPDLYQYPLIYMHGRTGFSMDEAEHDRLRTYLDRGGVLFADSCCGAKEFDRAFRKFIKELYPGRELAAIPTDHELFDNKIGSDLSKVRRRGPQADDPDAPLDGEVIVGPPVLEGIEIDDRLVVIYSKYDISCALEKQSSAACVGYLAEDALKIAINIVRYSLLQDLGGIRLGGNGQ